MSEADYEPMEKPGDEWHRQADEWTKEANDFRGANMNKHDGGPFLTSLETLRHNVMVSHSWVKDDYESAIRVLEAAGKINRDRDLRVLATLLKVYVQGEPIPELEQGLKGGAVREIRALLDALPDGEGEKKERNE